ncbi:MAG: S-layer homology domain-containing protein [Bacillota bacterium]
MRKKVCAVTVSLALSCQLLAAPFAMAATTDEVITNITKDPSYTNLVNQLNVNSSDVEAFVRDVVDSIDPGQLNNNDYIKGVVTNKLLTNETLTDAILSLSSSELNEAKNTVTELGNQLRTELLKEPTTPGPVGGGGGGVPSPEVPKPEELKPEEAMPEAKPVVKKFNDIEGHWAANDIEYMAEQGYINGVGEGKFKPQALVTRAEFVTMLVNVLGLQGEADVSFKDVSKGAWYYSNIAKAHKAGLAKGNGKDTFAPGAPITRQEMAAMVSNAMKHKGISPQADKTVLAVFADSSLIADWAKQAAAEVYAAKIIKGKPTNNKFWFAPKDNTTRAEAAAMLKNLLNVNK